MMIKMMKMRTMSSRKVTMTATMAVNKETSRFFWGAGITETNNCSIPLLLHIYIFSLNRIFQYSVALDHNGYEGILQQRFTRFFNIKKLIYKLSSFRINLSKQRQLRHNQQFLEISLWRIQTPWSADEATDGLTIDSQLTVRESFVTCCRTRAITARPVTGSLLLKSEFVIRKKISSWLPVGSIFCHRTENLWPADGWKVATWAANEPICWHWTENLWSADDVQYYACHENPINCRRTENIWSADDAKLLPRGCLWSGLPLIKSTVISW